MGEGRRELWRTAWRPRFEEYVPTMRRIGLRVWDDVGASATENPARLKDRGRIERRFRKTGNDIRGEIDPHKAGADSTGDISRVNELGLDLKDFGDDCAPHGIHGSHVFDEHEQPATGNASRHDAQDGNQVKVEPAPRC